MGTISLYVGLFLYPGNLFIYLVFSLFFCGFMLECLHSKNMFYIFISVFLWLGFWFKLSMAFILNKGKFYEPVGWFDYSSSMYDQALLVSIVGLMGLFLAKKIINIEQKSIPPFLLTTSDLGLKAHWIFLITIIFVTVYLNYDFSIFHRAIKESSGIPVFFLISIKWLMTVGFTAWALSLFYLNAMRKINVKWSLITLLAIDCLINISLYSRVFPLTGLFYLFIIEKLIGFNNFKLKIQEKTLILFVYFALCITNLAAVGFLRDRLYLPTAANDIITIEKLSPSGGIQNFIVGRWVGIEGVLATTAYDEKSLAFLASSLLESKQTKAPSFYDRFVVFKDTPYLNIELKNYYAITLPGFIGYMNYSGSLLIVFLSTLIFGLFSQGIIYILGTHLNPLITGFLGYLLAYRFVSFGYAPKDSYMLLLSILIIGVFPFIMKKINYRNKIFH